MLPVTVVVGQDIIGNGFKVVVLVVFQTKTPPSPILWHRGKHKANNTEILNAIIAKASS